MNLIDFLVFLYVAWGVWRGWRRGLSYELPRLVFAMVLLITGFGLWRWTARGISEMSAQTFGVFGFLGAIVAAYFLLRRLEHHIRDWATRVVADERRQKRWGALTGSARRLVLASFAILFISSLPIGFLSKPFTGGSFLGRALVRVVQPVQKLVDEEKEE